MSVLAAVICAAIWIIISFATGGSVLFSLGGGILLFVVAFIVGYAFRRLVIDRRRPVG
jgi:multisubunit Na+/H+ antiporter MnhE subunit